MNRKELISSVQRGVIPPRLPFVPVIYEHSAALINKAPSEIADNPEAIAEGQLAAYEIYGHDIVSVGVDIYNVEAEALGCKVIYPTDEGIPNIEASIIRDEKDLEQLEIPDPIKCGRMPIFIDATRIVNERIGHEVVVNGTIVGPFTLAAILRGFESFLYDMIYKEDLARQLLNFCTAVGMTYAEAFSNAGVGVAINESWIAPPLLSPALFASMVLPYEQRLISYIKALGQRQVTLVSGGNTAPIAQYLVQSGTSILIADYNTDQKYIKKLCMQYGITLRGNINPLTVERGDEHQIADEIKQVIDRCAAGGRFLFGCGIVSYGTSSENVLMTRKIVESLDPYKKRN